MPKEWTGNLVGIMHNNDITQQDVADEMGVKKPYISALLHSRKEPPGIQERMEKAVAAILERRKESQYGQRTP